MIAGSAVRKLNFVQVRRSLLDFVFIPGTPSTSPVPLCEVLSDISVSEAHLDFSSIPLPNSVPRGYHSAL